VLTASDDEMEVLTLDVAKGDVEVEALAIWFRQRLRPLPQRSANSRVQRGIRRSLRGRQRFTRKVRPEH